MKSIAPYQGPPPGWLGDPADRDFMRNGLCRNMPAHEADRMFFSDNLSRDEKRRAILSARNMCAQCPIAGQCQEYAITTHSDYGVWGGLTEDERQQITRRPKGGRRRVEV